MLGQMLGAVNKCNENNVGIFTIQLTKIKEKNQPTAPILLVDVS